ncbi:hypothetical protein ASZ90_004904 [hydrocarbon metagenome]|uniref:Uncharacterized protein n=1 Tax=hydrocarbon metagenome TaxID=938273 RepID=A0A0W8FWR4_9ZZZZ
MNFIQINSVSLILEEVDEVIDDESILSNGKNYNTIEIFNQYFKENNNG